MRSLSETDDMKLKLKSLSKIQAAFEGSRARSARRRTTHTERSPEGEIRHLVRNLNREPGNRDDRVSVVEEGSTVSTLVSREQTHEEMNHAGQMSRAEDTRSKSGSDSIPQIFSSSPLVDRESRQERHETDIDEKLKLDHVAFGTEYHVSPIDSLGEREVIEDVDVRHDGDNSTTTVRIINSPMSESDAKQAKEETQVVKIKAEKLKAEISYSPGVDTHRTDVKSEAFATVADKEHASAIKIQSTYRGFRARRDLQKVKAEKYDVEYEEWKMKRITAATTIQSGWRGYKVRKDLQEQEDMLPDEFSENGMPKLLVIDMSRTKEEIEQAHAKQNAASVIQLVFRASRKRHHTRIKSAKMRQHRHTLATSVQAAFWSVKTRLDIQRHTIATNLQSLFRAKLIRLQKQKRDAAAMIILKALKTNVAICRQRAALRIQAACRGHRCRVLMKQKRERNKQASILQACFRGFSERQQIQVAITQFNNATLLQSVFHAHRTRSEVHRNINATLLQSVFRAFQGRKLTTTKLGKLKTAATDLQAIFRAEITRRKEILRQEDIVAMYNAASLLQAVVIAHTCRWRNGTVKNKAALTIQCFYRDYISRKKETIRRENASISIQSRYRGYLGRKLARKHALLTEVHKEAIALTNLIVVQASDHLLNREKCATRIQAAVRGFLTRKRINVERKRKRLEEESRQKEEARRREEEDQRRKEEDMRRLEEKRIREEEAIKKMEGERRRQEETRKRKDAEERRKRRDNAASVIQTALRGKHRRDQINAVKQERMQNKSATMIQSLYRGYSMRKDQEREMRELSKIRPPTFSAGSTKSIGSSRSLSKEDELLQNARSIIQYHKNATELQEAFRAYITREETKVRMSRKLAITLITPRQRSAVMYKGPRAAMKPVTESDFSAKRKAQELLERVTIDKNVAASFLQACVHGYQTRLEYDRRKLRIERERTSARLRRRNQAANLIASVYRSFQKRRAGMSLRAEM